MLKLYLDLLAMIIYMICFIISAIPTECILLFFSFSTMLALKRGVDCDK